jgi:uncharacterized membrane protein
MKAYMLIYCAAVLLTGLLAGLFYGYSCSVNKGLGNLTDQQYLRAFQSINEAILNPVFFLSFAGSFFLLAGATIAGYLLGQTTAFYYSLAALLIYVCGVAGVTMAGNVPLNEQLAQTDLANASQETISALRYAFERPWNRYHTVRTIASVLSFGCMLFSLVSAARTR